MLINIDAWSGAGKSVLLSLLDGHPEIFCAPVHDYTFMPFSDTPKKPDYLKNFETEYIRSLLSRSGYYRIEFYSRKKTIPFCLSSTDNAWVFVPFDLDFYDFERSWVDTASSRSDLNTEQLISEIYSSLQKSLGLSPKPLVASMSQVSAGYLRPLLERFDDMKTIHIRRSLEGVMATRCNRTHHPMRGKSINKGFSGPFRKRLLSGEIEKICKHYRDVDKIETDHSDRLMSIDFNSLVTNPETEIKRVADFLNVAYTSELCAPTILGTPLSTKDHKYVGEENDDPSLLLTLKEKKIIRISASLSRLHRQAASPLHPFRFAKSILRPLKRLA